LTMTNTLPQTQSNPPGAVSEATSTLAEKASEVGTTLSDQTRGVASDAKDHARRMMDESRESLRSEASNQATRLAATMREVGSQLHSMAQSQSGGGVAVDVTRQLSDAAHRAAQKLDTGGVDDVLADLKRFARRRPGLFLVGAVGAGFAVGRLLKAADTHSLMQAAQPSHEDSSAMPAASVLASPSLASPSLGSPSLGSTSVATPSLGIAETIQ